MKNNNEIGKLPKAINAIIIESFHTIDFETLRVWMHQKRLCFNINDKYMLPSINQLKEMVELTIKQFFLINSQGTSFSLTQDICIGGLHFDAGFIIVLKDWYFEVDFEIHEYDEIRDDFYVESYRQEIKQIARVN